MGVSIGKANSSTLKKKSKQKIAIKVYREIMTPSQKKVSITLPETLVGKTVEVFAIEVHPTKEPDASKRKSLTKKDFWNTFGSGKDSTISGKYS